MCIEAAYLFPVDRPVFVFEKHVCACAHAHAPDPGMDAYMYFTLSDTLRDSESKARVPPEGELCFPSGSPDIILLPFPKNLSDVRCRVSSTAQLNYLFADGETSVNSSVFDITLQATLSRALIMKDVEPLAELTYD